MTGQQMQQKIESDLDKLTSRMGKARAMSKALVAQNEELLEHVDNGMKEANARLQELKVKLTVYTEGRKDMDDEFTKMRRTYQNLLHDRDTLRRARDVLQEGIGSAELGQIGPVYHRGESKGAVEE